MMNISVILENERGSFLVKHFGDCVFDICVFIMADNMFKDYTGGFWDYAEGDNAAFLIPRGSENITLRNIFSGEESVVDAVLGGMILTSFALLYQIEKGVSDYIPLHDNLNRSIAQHCADIGRMDAWWALMD